MLYIYLFFSFNFLVPLAEGCRQEIIHFVRPETLVEACELVILINATKIIAILDDTTTETIAVLDGVINVLSPKQERVILIYWETACT